MNPDEQTFDRSEELIAGYRELKLDALREEFADA